jgi:predicted nucleic acid-binding protein
MIFVDTSIWYASHVAEDPAHVAARALLATASQELVTTDYVVDELLTLLTVRRHRAIAERLGGKFWAGQVCRLHWTSQADVAAAWQTFLSHADKSWSFTDCVSHAVMLRLKISEAYSLDDHFRQFGTVTVHPT